jgi:TRAP-type C4-dicarboxylate transport system permease small subunit
MKLIKKCLSAVTSVTDGISMFFLCLCTATAVINTIMRYIFKNPLNWSEELCVISLIFIVFTSLPQLEKQNDHLCMTALYNALSPKIKKVLGVIRSILTIAVCAWLCKAGIDVAMRNFNMNIKTQVMDLPYGIIYMIIPASFVLIILVRMANITIRSENEGLEGIKEGTE